MNHFFTVEPEKIVLSRIFSPIVAGTVFCELSISSTDVHDATHESPWINGSISFELLLRIELQQKELKTSLTIRNTHDTAQGVC